MGGTLAWAAVCLVTLCSAQTGAVERVFPQSKAAVEKALKSAQASIAGRLPSLEGFAQPGEHPLERYERGYYQTTVQVSAAPAGGSPSGGSKVRVSVKLTAWYNDPANTHSGYQLLTSNGRLEADLLDQLAEELAKGSSETERGTLASTAVAAKPAATVGAEPAISAPAPKSSDSGVFSSSRSQSLAEQERAMAHPVKPETADKTDGALQAEAQSLEEVLKNQGHPKNLVAVKKSGTPVVGTPSLTAKPLFLASLHDEFEMLDYNADWVHVRVSGISRAWIWRNSLEMPEGIPDTQANAKPGLAPAADLFHVQHEETAPFPGDWEPLRNKSVKIISVQKIDENEKDAGPKERLEYAKFLLETNYKEMASKTEQAGIVVIFDSSDGGMIAATVATLAEWKAGRLSDAALWHKCFFDPPETFDSSASGASQ
jgi:hypothetical protein